MRTMRAPYTAVLRTLAGSRSAGMKTQASKPCCAACAATALARLPVEEQPTVVKLKRRAADGVWAAVAFGKRQKLGIAPHVEVAASEVFPADSFLQGIVIVGDFERGETVFAKRAGDVAPGFAAFAASKFVVDRHCEFTFQRAWALDEAGAQAGLKPGPYKSKTST